MAHDGAALAELQGGLRREVVGRKVRIRTRRLHLTLFTVLDSGG
jgi:hypothetical protein